MKKTNKNIKKNNINTAKRKKRRKKNSNINILKVSTVFIGFALILTIVIVVAASEGVFKLFPNKDSGNSNYNSNIISSEQISLAESVTPTKTPKPDLSAEAVIMATGDIIIHDSLLEGGLTSSGKYDFSHLLEHVEDIFSISDYVTVNFEGTTTAPKYGGWPAFNAPDEIAYAIAKSGVDMVTTANNHSYDKGIIGVKRTVEVFRGAGLKVIGTRSTPQEPLFEIVDINGIKVGFAGYTYETSGTENSRAINGLVMKEEAWPLVDSFNYFRKIRLAEDKKEMENRINSMRKAGAEAIIFNIHWGEEYKTRANDKQEELAHFLADCGVDVIFGHHPHVLQQIDVIESKGSGRQTLVYYSLSNIMGNMLYSTHNSQGNAEDAVIARVVIKRDEMGDVKVTEGKYIKTYIWKDNTTYPIMHRAIPVKEGVKSPNKFKLGNSLSLIEKSDDRITKVLSSSHREDEIFIGEFIP